MNIEILKIVMVSLLLMGSIIPPMKCDGPLHSHRSFEGMATDDESRGLDDGGPSRSMVLERSPFDYFVANEGQFRNDSIYYCSRNACFGASEMIFHVLNWQAQTATPHLSSEKSPSQGPGTVFVYKMTFLGANQTIPRGIGEPVTTHNYIIGNDSSRWRIGVPCHEKIEYPGLYPGIDLIYTNTPDGLKYDFLVHPGADVGAIRFKIEGAEASLEGTDILIKTPLGTVRDGAFKAYQLEGTERRTIDAGIRLDENVFSYHAEHDGRFPLVIDPLIHSTFLGGSGWDTASDLKLNAARDAYIIGETWSSDFPTVPGSYDTAQNGNCDAFVLKIGENGSKLVYSTFIGGSGDDNGNSIALDSSKNPIITGKTHSPDFPTTPGASDTSFNGYESDAFVLKLDGNGSKLEYSTFIGGIDEDGGTALSLDGQDNACVAGETRSWDFPTTPGACNRSFTSGPRTFVSKLSADGSSLVFSTFLGGWSPSIPGSIAVGGNNDAFVLGEAASADFPTTAGAFDRSFNGGVRDLFVARLSADGSALVFSTFIGGKNDEYAGELKLDALGNPVLTGGTYSSDFPVNFSSCDAVFQGSSEAFLCGLNATGSTLDFSTFLGGERGEYSASLDVDSQGSIHVAGATDSRQFPVTSDAVCGTFNGGYSDMFVSNISADGSRLTYSTYFGGSQDDRACGIAFGADGLSHVAGYTSSQDLDTTEDGLDRTYNGGTWDACYVVLGNTPPGAPGNLTAAPGDRHVLLTWTPANDSKNAPVTNYLIHRGLTSSNLSFLAMVGTETACNDTTVTNGVEYHYAVSSLNSAGEGNLSKPVNVTPGASPTPPGFLAVQPGYRFVNLSWRPPDDVRGFQLTGYGIYRGRYKTDLAPLVTVGNVTEYRDSNVSNGLTYHYAVTGINERGESARSGTAEAQVGSPPFAPGNLSWESGDQYISIDWSAPLDDGGYIVTLYRLHRSEPGLVPERTVETAERSLIDTDVANGIDYCYTVSAVNVKGEGPRSERIVARPGKVPDAPRLAVVGDDGVVRLTWESGNDGGYPILDFRIFRGQSPSELKFWAATGGAGHYNDTDVENGRTYHYSVSAVNGKGEGERSLVGSARPLGPPRKVPGLNLTGGDGLVWLCWTEPESGGAPILKYRIFRGENESSLTILNETVFLEYRDVNVTNGVTYHYRVAGVNQVGEGVPCDAASARPVGRPGKVQQLHVETGAGLARVTWLPPASDGGTPIKGYKVFRNGPGSDFKLLAETTQTRYDDAAVSGNSTYTYRVMAFNEVGDGAPSEVSARVPPPPVELPGPPGDFKVECKDGKVYLSWSRPDSPVTPAILGYRLYKGVSPSSLVLLADLNATTYTDRNVAPGKTYHYSVSALNEAGEGNSTRVLPVTVPPKVADDTHVDKVLIPLLLCVVVVVILGVVLMYSQKRKRKEE